MGTESIRERVRQQLAQAGLRVTPQRLLVMEILEEADEHLDAEAIYERARDRDPLTRRNTITLPVWGVERLSKYTRPALLKPRRSSVRRWA